MLRIVGLACGFGPISLSTNYLVYSEASL